MTASRAYLENRGESKHHVTCYMASFVSKNFVCIWCLIFRVWYSEELKGWCMYFNQTKGKRSLWILFHFRWISCSWSIICYRWILTPPLPPPLQPQHIWRKVTSLALSPMDIERWESTLFSDPVKQWKFIGLDNILNFHHDVINGQ